MLNRKNRKDSKQLDTDQIIDLNSSNENKGKEENSNININNINQPPRNTKFFVKE